MSAFFVEEALGIKSWTKQNLCLHETYLLGEINTKKMHACITCQAVMSALKENKAYHKIETDGEMLF